MDEETLDKFEEKGKKEVAVKKALESNEGKLIEIKNLIVSPMPMRSILLGDTYGLIDMVNQKKEDVSAIFWNESSISLMLRDNGMEITFHPEFHKSTTMFFDREIKRRGNWDDDRGVRVWEGEFEAVQFKKKDLLKFLNKYSSYFDEELEKAIKNMRVTEKKEQRSEMLSLDEDATRTIEEESRTTNIPRKFSATMPLFDGLEVELNFEAVVKTKKDNYGHYTKTKIIELRCTNAREAMQDAMNNVLSRMPKEIPKYYGKMTVHDKGKRGY